jgi:hypothetical protein
LLLVVGAATLEASLKARTEDPITLPSVNVEGRGRTASVPPDYDEPRQPITNAVKSSAATPSLPPLSTAPLNERVEAQVPATSVAFEKPVPSPQCNVPVCQRFYRSFHRSDCTYQPFSGGARRICDR